MRNYVKRITKKADKLPKEQLLSLLDEVSEENDNLYAILDSLSTGIYIVDQDFILIQNNSIAESRLPLSISLDEIKNLDSPIWDYIEDDDISAYLRKCSEKEITNSSEEFSILTPGGSVRFITITISPLINKGRFTGSIILVQDITEKKSQDVLLHRMENLANLTNLAAGMAHEIKNPLGAISIHIQLIQKALNKARENENILPPKKFVEDHIEVVNEEIDHLNKLVMDFLMAVRPVKATLELKNPDKILENLVNFFVPEFHKAGIHIEFKNADSNAKILLDEKLFREVFINLSQNSLAAIKSRFPECENFTGKKEEEFPGRLNVTTLVSDNKFKIKISDNGCGMSEETVSKIFEPYFTTKANGTGLGMTMVYKIVKEFSGEILVDSQVDKGTTFTLTFPIPQKDTKLLATENR